MHSNLLSVAPMLDCTDRHFRYLIRLISRHILLYTEMLTTNEILAPNGAMHLQLHPIESPIVMQLGGSDPAALAHCAILAEQAGFNEINLNVGCPSSRVQRGGIGACLMRQPKLVADCIAAMKAVVTIPVTVKCRLGVDYDDSYEQLAHFVRLVAEAGCGTFSIHARKAWLTGLNPKQNRTIPPLDYNKVYRIKQDFPHLEIILNGGVVDLIQVDEHLKTVDGVMIGRAIYNNPMLLKDVDHKYYGQQQIEKDPKTIVSEFMDYVDQQLQLGTRLSVMTKHLLTLFQGVPGAKHWRRFLSCNSSKPNAGSSIILQALQELQ